MACRIPRPNSPGTFQQVFLLIMPLAWNLILLVMEPSSFLVDHCQYFVNQTSEFIRFPCYSRKTMVASKRYKDLYWLWLEPYV